MKTGTCGRTFDKWVKIKYPVVTKSLGKSYSYYLSVLLDIEYYCVEWSET